MESSPSWRDQLLGSLQGQLQLATYLAVFVGFTGASSVGLWTGQRNLIQNNASELRRSAASIQACLSKGGTGEEFVQQELLLHSSMRTSLWVETPMDRWCCRRAITWRFQTGRFGQRWEKTQSASPDGRN